MATSRARARWLRAARVASALALFVVAGDHLYEYSADYYSSIPTIGTLFLLNAIGGFAIGVALLVPVERLLAKRAAIRLTVALAVAGIALAGLSLVALFVSESTPLFGFMEVGYRTSIVIAIAAEAAAVLSLTGLILLVRPASRMGTSTHSRRRPRVQRWAHYVAHDRTHPSGNGAARRR